MGKTSVLAILFIVLLNLPCKSQERAAAYSSKTLKIIPITEHSFVHVSYLNTTDYGKVGCNGLIYIKGSEAVVFDTPTSTEVSEELLRWVMEEKEAKVTAVVINHFHWDCLGGLQAFHELNIPSYANTKTIQLAKSQGNDIPQIGFDGQNELEVGGEKISNRHFGEAHTKDNIASYIPSEKLLFGGCPVKSLNAQKGNLADANVKEWSNTIAKIKKTYPGLKIVVPGHGATGGPELLDYTIALFKMD